MAKDVHDCVRSGDSSSRMTTLGKTIGFSGASLPMKSHDSLGDTIEDSAIQNLFLPALSDEECDHVVPTPRIVEEVGIKSNCLSTSVGVNRSICDSKEEGEQQQQKRSQQIRQ